jgi:tetratricopeptide (TPR) repeat protein
MKKWPKVRSISNNITELCESLKEATRKMDDDPIGMSFAPSNDIDNEDLDHLDQSFMYTQLIKEILLELNYDNKSVQDLVDYCRKKYAGKETELKTITKLEQDYREEKPIWWYTIESFLYRMLNKTLREQHFESIIRMGFFIYDLHRHIDQLHKEQKTKFTEPFKVYRSQGMSRVDFEKLKKSKGGLLAFNSFLSTSLDYDAAQKFLRTSLRDSQLITIFFTLSIDPSVSSAPFALIDEVSYFKTEKEILFSMLTVFRIERIEQNDADDRIWNVDLTLTSDSDQQMNRLLERMRKEIEGSTPLYRLGALMIKLDQLNQAEEVYKTLFAHTTDQLEKGNLFYQLGQIKYNQGHNDEAISNYEEALKIYSETLPSDHPNIATIYNNIGLVYDSKNDYSQALASYQKAQQIYESKLDSNHPILANCYNNIASAYDNLKNYKQALTFYDKSYQIYEKTLPAKHPHIATYYSNIGTVHSNMKEYAKALACFEKAVQIGRDTLPVGHSDLDTYRKNLESMRGKLKK